MQDFRKIFPFKAEQFLIDFVNYDRIPVGRWDDKEEKMMKKTMIALLLVVSVLTGCGASGGNMAMDSAPSENITANGGYMKDDYETDYDSGYDYGWSGETEMPEAPESAPDTPTGETDALANAKMIYTADVTLETRDFDSASAAVTELVDAMGGYFERRELNQGGTYRSLYCTIRVPASRFTETLDQSGEIAHLTYRNEYSQNVSEAYYDLEARLTTQRTKLKRLQELLAEAKDMSDIIVLESEISNTELQIEYLTGSLRSYDSLIDYSTIHLTLREVYRLSDEEVAPVTFGDRLKTAFERGLAQAVDNFEDLLIYVARNWLNLLVWAAVITGVVVLVRRKVKKFRAERQGRLPAEQPQKTEETKEK